MSCRRPSASRRRFVLVGTVASILAGALVFCPHTARAGNIWDGGAPNANWSTAANWDFNILPDFATPITFAGNTNLVTNNDLNAITVGGIIFDPLADAFTLRGNDLTLNGSIVNSSFAEQTINLAMTVNSTQIIDVALASLTIGPGGSNSGIISGAGGITKTGLGLLTLGAANTYTGTTTFDGGVVAYSADNTVTALNFGAIPTATTASTNTTTLDLTNASLTASSLTVQSNTSAFNTINVGTGKTLTINGAMLVGVNDVYSATVGGVRTSLSVAGSSMVVNGGSGHFTIGYSRSNAAGGGDPAATVNLTQLADFTYNATGGELRIGGGNVVGSLFLANTSNTIVASQVRIGDSSVLQAGGGNNNGGASIMMLGSGTNVINANSIIIGATKSHGTVGFQDPTLGTLTIAGQAGGASTANITICNATSATLAGGTSALNLDGHAVNIQAGTVIIGRLGGSTGGTGSGSISFDTGTFTAANLQLAVNVNGSSTNGAVGTLTIGGSFPNPTSTAILNVTNQFLLANRTNGTISPATGTFIINGGTANINADILDASTTGDPATRNTTVTLAAGTLNMMGHAIGSLTAPITNVNMPPFASTATLANLGGGGINGVGLTINTGGVLILEGTNSYTGTTTIGPGSTIQVGTGMESGTLGMGDVVNDGTLIFDRTGLIAVTGAISGAGNLQKMGAGTVVISGAGTYAGPTEINQGTLAVTGSITSAVNITSGGVLSGSGDGTTTGKTGNVIMTVGSSLRPGPTGAPGDVGTLTVAGLVVSGGDIQLDLDVVSDRINVLGPANFTAASTISPSAAASPGSYTVLTASALTLGVLPTILTPPNTRQSFTPDFSTPNTIKIVVAGITKSIFWTGLVNSVWQPGSAGPLNWNDGVAPDRFFNADTVTFGNGPANRSIVISGTVAPAAVTVNNSAGNDYVFSGGSIGGSASIMKSGPGKLTFASANSHAGGITLNAGTLNVNHAAALGVGALTIAGGSLDNTSGAPVVVTTNNPQNWNASFSFNGANSLDLGGGAVTLSVSPVVTVDASTLAVGGNISGAFALTKAGPGSLSLAGANSLTDGVTLNGGTLNINNSNALGTGAFTITGGAIDNTSGGAINLAGNLPQNWNGDFTFVGTNSLNLGTGAVTQSADRGVNVVGSTLTVGGVIGGSFGLTKTGTGTLILSGASTHTGAVNINAGRLTITNATVAAGSSSLGALAGGAVTVASGATLDLSGNLTAQQLNFGAKAFTIAGTGTDGTGTIINNGVSQFNALQHVTLSADATIGGSARFDIRSVPTTALNANLTLANHTLTKIGANQFSLVGTDVSDGNIVVNQGTFSIETVTNIPDFGTGRTLTFNAGTTLQFFSNTTVPSTVTRPMVFNGAGIQIGSGSNNNNSTIGSSITLNGDVTFATLGGATATTTLTLTGNLSETGGPRSITKTGASRLTLTGSSSYTGTTMINGGVLQIGDGGTNGTLAPGNVVAAGTLAFNRLDDVTVSNVISGSGGLTQLGAGVLTVTGTNSYVGATTVANGTMKLGTATAYPSGSALVLGDVFGTSGIFDLSGFNLNVSGLSTVGFGFPNLVGSSSTTAPSLITFNTGTTEFGGMIQDALGAGNQTVALTVASGALTLSGENTYTGPTNVNSGGTLQIGAGFSTGTFGTGPVTVNGIIAFNRSDDFTVSTAIAGAGELHQDGFGRLILSAINTLSGPTTINAGTLVVSGSLTGTSSVSVLSGASLGGKGTLTTALNGNVVLAAGASLAPGDGVGTLTLALGGGTLDLSATAGSNSYLQFELGPTGDRVRLTSGSLTIGADALDLDDFAFTNAGGLVEGTYVLFDTSSDIAGTLGSHLQDDLLGFKMTLQFANGVNGRDDLVLVVVPEPQSAAVFLAGLGALAFRRRKGNA